MNRFHPPGECPVCGAEVPAGAKACPECGASDSDGWSEDTDADGLELPPSEDERLEDENAKEKRSPSQAFNITVMVLIALVLSGLWFVFQK